MSNDKEHHSLHHRDGEDAMLIRNVDSTSNMACQQVKLVSSGKHKLTYHILKKQIRERNRYDHISHNGHGTDREEKITFRGLEPTPCTASNENQQTLSTHTCLGKKDAKQIYMKQIKDTPSIACAICDQLNFAKNTKSFTPDLEAEYLGLTLNDRTFSSGNICLPCKRSLENGKLPHFATPDQIRCNTPLPDVSTLTELEERLVSLRIAFAQIRPWGYKRPQMGLTGSIINVPVQLDVVQKSLPQFISDTMTIVVALKRRLQYKNAYQTGKVCVHVVMKALKELCSRALYKAQNICINENWNNVLGEGDDNSAQTLETASEFDTSDESENERPAETLIHGFTDSQRIRDLQDKIVEIAPAEGQRPLGIFKDKFAEEMNFPTLFYGDPRPSDITE
jgi:hypothetical protein